MIRNAKNTGATGGRSDGGASFNGSRQFGFVANLDDHLEGQPASDLDHLEQRVR